MTKSRCRHVYGAMKEGSFKDGTYQWCVKCGRTRFYGERGTLGKKKKRK